MNLSPHLFWDTDPSKVDYERNARWLIERVFAKGLMSDVREIQQFYGDDRIKEELQRCRHLDRLTLNFASKVYHIPKEDFRCYNTPQHRFTGDN